MKRGCDRRGEVTAKSASANHAMKERRRCFQRTLMSYDEYDEYDNDNDDDHYNEYEYEYDQEMRYSCTQDGCDYKTKERIHLKRHLANIHDIGVQ